MEGFSASNRMYFLIFFKYWYSKQEIFSCRMQISPFPQIPTKILKIEMQCKKRTYTLKSGKHKKIMYGTKNLRSVSL